MLSKTVSTAVSALVFGDSRLVGDFVDVIQLAQSAASSVILLRSQNRRSRHHVMVSMAGRDDSRANV